MEDLQKQVLQPPEVRWQSVISGVNSDYNSITLHNGSYAATGRSGPGIGSGYATGGSSSVQSVLIFDGNITSTNSGYGGPNIGSGHGDYGNSSVMNLTISNGNITSLLSKSTSKLNLRMTYHRFEKLLINDVWIRL
jgi:hypothetical protein